MSKRTSDYSSDTDQRVEGEDVNLLRRPNRAAFAGFKEARIAFEHGTDEVRRLLLHECNFIYECNVCRNMFRSLGNFISHKRKYCTSAFAYSVGGNSNGFPDPHKDEHTTKLSKTESLKTDLLQTNKCATSKFVNGNSATGFLGHESEPQDSDKIKSGEPVGIKTEVDQLISKMEKVLWKQALFGTIGSNVTNGEANAKNAFAAAAVKSAEPSQKMEPKAETRITCETCNMKLPSEKALRIHNQKKHHSSTYAFQCPACPLTFLQPAAVIRHLAHDHKKSVRRIRMMREAIVKRRIQPGEVCPVKQGSNRELKRLQVAENGSAADNDAAEPKKIMSKCIYCEKSFERRAALSTHLMSCRLKLEALEKQHAPVEKRSKLSHYTSNTESVPPATTAVGMHATVKEEAADSDSLNEMFANLDKQSFGVGLKTVSLDKLEVTESGNESMTGDTAPNLSDVQLDKTASSESMVSPEFSAKGKSKTSPASANSSGQNGKQLSCRCKICNKQFNALSNLRRHISMFHYRARKFGCKLCEYRAFRRYDIVNHLGFVHKMTDDRETMSEEFVAVHEVHYSKDDMDGDIVLMAEEQDSLVCTKEKQIKTYEKRVRRKKPFITAAVSIDTVSDEGDGKPTRHLLKRSHSQQGPAAPTVVTDGGGTAKSQQKRPIRNRIKPVNKDFVYDLSTLLKEEIPTVLDCGETAARQPKRRNTLFSIADPFYQPEPIALESLIYGTQIELIRGATQRITLLLVQQGRAASATLPELPAERPQMRPRLTSTCRVDMQAVPVIETSDLEAARLKSTLLEDSFLEKISKRSTGGRFKIKPCLELQHSALDTLLQKVDSSYQNNCSGNNIGSSGIANENIKLKIISTSATPIDAICELSAAAELAALRSPLRNAQGSPEFPEPEAIIIPNSTSPPATPRKRITLIQRLAENKATKHRDSLLRSALEN